MPNQLGRPGVSLGAAGLRVTVSLLLCLPPWARVSAFLPWCLHSALPQPALPPPLSLPPFSPLSEVPVSLSSLLSSLLALPRELQASFLGERVQCKEPSPAVVFFIEQNRNGWSRGNSLGGSGESRDVRAERGRKSGVWRDLVPSESCRCESKASL